MSVDKCFSGGYCVLASPHEQDKAEPSWLAVERQRALVFEVLKIDISKARTRELDTSAWGL